MSTREEFLQYIVIETITIDDEEPIQTTGRSISISRSIQVNIVLSEPSLVVTNDSYFSESPGRTKADVLSEKVIVPKDLQGPPITRQHDTHLYGATKSFYLLFVSANAFVVDSRTGELDTDAPSGAMLGASSGNGLCGAADATPLKNSPSDSACGSPAKESQ